MIEGFLIGREDFEAQKLFDSFPPRLFNANKKVVWEKASPKGSLHSGTLSVSRWQKMPIPETFEDNSVLFEIRPGFFDYGPVEKPRDAWYLNFAHHDLFCAYGAGHFAQDEIQVAEHPILGSLREALKTSGIKPLTVEHGKPTPILIRGVERRCSISTSPDKSLGRPNGLYGRNFGEASPEAVEKAVSLIEPPTLSNLIAIEAPASRGLYTRDQLEFILETAFTGFAAARAESERAQGPSAQVIVHTGFWGCGAYGGNRTVMVTLQVLAARLAGLHTLAFHAGDDAGKADCAKARRFIVDSLPQWLPGTPVREVVDAILAVGFKWGVSDGN